MRVRYTSTQTRAFTPLPVLNAAQSARLKEYCKLQGPIELAVPTKLARDMGLREGSHYVGDLLRCLYPRFLNQRFYKEFGDVNWIPAAPAFVKSRPISDDNHNAVLLPMDVRRHMFFPHDPFSFDSKTPAMVWRGASFQNKKASLGGLYVIGVTKLNYANTTAPDRANYGLLASVGKRGDPHLD